PPLDRNAIERELPVSRLALRRILLEGVDHVVHFGKQCIAFDDAPHGGVMARFADGSTATGGVLIGADGASSHLRAQLVPSAQRVETGIVAVTGKLGLNADTRALTPQPIFPWPDADAWPPRLLPVRQCRRVWGWALPTPPCRDRARSAPLRARRVRDVGLFRPSGDVGVADGSLDALEGGMLQDAVVALMDAWHPALMLLV